MDKLDRLCEEFQSTLPVWGATLSPPGGCKGTHYFNPRSPCGERRAGHARLHLIAISIHAPRVGSDFWSPGRP